MADPASLRQQLQTAEAQWHAERLNLEQLLHQCEREREELVLSHALCEKEISTSKLELDSSQNEIQHLKQALEHADDKLQRLQTTKEELAGDLEAERARSAQLISRNAAIESECDRIREECARYSDRQMELTKQVNETERALAMEKALMKPVQIQLADAEQRQKLLQTQNDTLEKELESRSEQLLEIQRRHGAQLGQLTNSNELLQAQCKEWESRYQSSVEEVNTLKSKLTEALSQAQEERHASVSASCQYQSELDAEKRLSTTLKRSLNEAKESIADLERALESLKSDHKEATDRVHELEQKLETTESSLKTSEENLNHMRNELAVVKDQNLQPLPAIETPGEGSVKDLKIEEVVGRLMQTQHQLNDERKKSRKLQLYLEQIEEELNEQVPLLQEERADYQNLLKVNSNLAQRVQECNYQRDQLERKLQQALQRAESEYKQRQELIQFIQRQGIEGFDQNDAMQIAIVTQDENDVNSWRKLVEQLEEELKRRDLQLARLETEIRSRALLASGTNNHAPATSLPLVSAASPPVEAADQKLIDELRDQIEMLQTEKSASERQLQNNVDEARRQYHELSVKLASTEGSVALLNQKLEWITSQANRFSAENEKLRSHDAQRDALLIVTQEKVSTLTTELSDANQRYARSSNQLQQVRAQLDLARQTEERLTEQCGDMAVLRQHNEQLLAAMHSVQQKLESGQTSNVQQLTAEKERIYQDLLQTQKQAAVERRQLQQNLKVLEEQCQSLQSQLAVANKATDEATNKLAQLAAAASTAESAHSKLMEELRAVKNERDLLANNTRTDDEDGGGGGRQLMIELAHAQAEAQSLGEKVATLQTEANEWKALCEQRAQLLNELEENLQAQRQRSETDIETLRNRIEELTDQCRKSDQQYEDLLSQLEQKDSLSTNQARELEGRIVDAERRSAHAEQKYQIAQESAAAKEQEAADYRRRYESELTGHAEAIKSVNEIRQQIIALQQQYESARQTESDAVEALNTLQQQSQREISSLNAHLKEARETIANLSKQNDLLLAQVETGRFTKPSEASEEGEEGDRTRQIIAFLRSEKEIAEAEAESAARQVVRLKTEIDQLRTSLDQARDEIGRLQENQSAMPLDQETKPSEDISVLLESNQMLRNQKMEIMNQFKQLEEQFSQLQETSGPMQSQIAELNATVASLQAEKAALQADVERWKTRNQQLLSRYNQVDPELYRQAKESLAEAKQEVEQLQSRLQSKDSQITELQDKLARANQGQANIETIRRSAVFNLQQVNALKRELANRPDPAQFAAQLNDAQKCIKNLRALCSRSRSVLEKRNEAVTNLQGQVDTQKSEIASLSQKASDLQDRLSECETSLQKSEESHAAELSSCQDQLTSLQLQLADANERLQTDAAENTEMTPAETVEDTPVQHKRPPSPTVQPAPKKLKTQEPEESAPLPEPEKQQEKQTEEVGAVPIRRLRRVRAASSASQEPTALPSTTEPTGTTQAQDETGENTTTASITGAVEEEDNAAGTTGAGPSSDAEEGEISDNNASMDV